MAKMAMARLELHRYRTVLVSRLKKSNVWGSS